MNRILGLEMMGVLRDHFLRFMSPSRQFTCQKDRNNTVTLPGGGSRGPAKRKRAKT
jgi:hypothetical protein